MFGTDVRSAPGYNIEGGAYVGNFIPHFNQEVAMPSNAEITAYAKRLPAIYRDIMAAFPAVEPARKAGYGLAFQTLAVHFVNTGRGYSLGDVQNACMRLADSGFLEIRNGIFAHPAELGEQLIAAVTGKPPAPVANVPELPAPTW